MERECWSGGVFWHRNCCRILSIQSKSELKGNDWILHSKFGRTFTIRCIIHSMKRFDRRGNMLWEASDGNAHVGFQDFGCYLHDNPGLTTLTNHCLLGMCWGNKGSCCPHWRWSCFTPWLEVNHFRFNQFSKVLAVDCAYHFEKVKFLQEAAKVVPQRKIC